MKAIQLATIALLLGAVTDRAAHGQPPGYGHPQSSQPGYGYDAGYDRGLGPQADVGFFYHELSPYGDWVRTRDYGWAWFPGNVPPYWRPYLDGRWVVSEYGWTWVSNEPFGWATYHYGRWALDPRFGWLWVPGTVWGPAWVSWQSGGGYVGWAPLPPTVGFEIGIGLQLGGFDLTIGIHPDAYSFVPERSFLEHRVSGHLLPTARNITIIHNTTNITNYTYVDNRVVNRGIDVRQIEQATGRRLTPLRLTEAKGHSRSEVSGSEVRIYRPDRKRLDTVRVGPRVDDGPRKQPLPEGRDQGRPGVQRGNGPEIVVAPRIDRRSRPDAERIDQENRRERGQLTDYMAKEKKKLDKLHEQELDKARTQPDRQRIAERHQTELRALQEEQHSAAQQLALRQKARRQAVMESAPPTPVDPNEKGDVDSKKKKKKKKEKEPS